MAVTHRLVLPEGAAPDSISAEDWNAEHDGVSGGGGSFDGILPEGTVYQPNGEPEPRILFQDGILYFGDGQDPIEMPSQNFGGQWVGSPGIAIRDGQLSIVAEDFHLVRPGAPITDAQIDGGIGQDWNFLSAEATAIDTEPGPYVLKLTTRYWDGAASQQKQVTLRMVADASDPDASFLEIAVGPHEIHLRADGNVVLPPLPAADPGITGALYTQAGAVMQSA